MTASAGAWYRVGKVNVTNDNQSVVGVDTNWQSDVIAIAIGDIFTLDAKTWYEVIAVNSDTSITLDRGFEGSTGTNKTYAILRNTSGTILTRIAGQVSVQFNQKQLFLDELRTWLNSDNESEELTDSHGLKKSLKTPSQMVRDHDEKLAELDTIHPYPYAMRKVEFEARRAANNEKFAASGFVHKGRHYDNGRSEVAVAEGLYVRLDVTNELRFGRSLDVANSGESKTGMPVLNIAGVTTKLEYLGKEGVASKVYNSVILPPVEDGTRTYDSATGVSVTHATPAIAFASETDTNKVVTDRVDMWGFEAFLREINDADPFVYSKGLIQSLAPIINGVPTVSDNVRPITYFAWYEGDESSRGKGVNWKTASEAQRTAIASNHENNIYFDDATGKFYQWCVRGRSFAGKGNGDWGEVDAVGTAYLDYSISAPIEHIRPLGNRNSVSMAGSGFPLYSARQDTVSHFGTAESLGIFGAMGGTSSYDSVAGIGGECYFLVCGTVSRLNQGAYHPSYNPLGASKVYSQDLSSTLLWYDTDGIAINTPQDAYGPARALGTGSLYPGKVGRPDGRFYDTIYASGQGGVCRDMRYSAWGLTQEDFAEADLKVKSGEYRGRERLHRVQFLPEAYLGYPSGENTSHVLFREDGTGTGEIIALRAAGLNNGDPVLLKQANTGRTLYGRASTSDGYIALGLDTRVLVSGHTMGLASEDRSSPWYIMKLGLTESLASEYTHTEVIGDPANILLCDDLKDGWVGSWNPTIPDGVVKDYLLNKKVSSGSPDRILTSDLGTEWVYASSYPESEINNAFIGKGIPTSEIWIINYNTKAVVTQGSVNSPVHSNLSGIGAAFFSMERTAIRGAELNYSLTSKVATYDSTEAINSGSLLIDRISIRADGEIDSNATYKPLPTHAPLPLSASTNNSPAVKALNYNVVENQQGFINYAYTELKHNGTDWGDDSKIHVANNQTTMLDTNGNTVKVGTARIVEPLGWIKNDK